MYPYFLQEVASSFVFASNSNTTAATTTIKVSGNCSQHTPNREKSTFIPELLNLHLHIIVTPFYYIFLIREGLAMFCKVSPQ
mmetsp:Transcript_14351/g.24538  ORF Transcript_14351/g.24538 Transcript_14351/m.24538 type:complete len:82 (+) Transcript_14351:155-400(+)